MITTDKDGVVRIVGKSDSPVVAFFKPTQAEMEYIIDKAIDMHKRFLAGGIPESMAAKMVWLWWSEIMKPSLEAE